MAHNPFDPPQAQLELEEELGPVPARVRIAVVAIISGEVMSFALKAAAAAGFTAFSRSAQATPAAILPAALPLLLMGVLAWKIFVGRDWARWILGAIVGLGALGLASMFYLPPEFSTRIPQSVRIASTIQLGLNLAAFVLLFTGDAAKWFHR